MRWLPEAPGRIAPQAPPPAAQPDAGDWDRLRPATASYLHDAHGLHGLGHAARVLVWADLLARQRQDDGVALDREAVRWAATLHDVRRRGDGRDLLHGARCSAWVRDGADGLFGAPSRAVDASRLGRIAYCCHWHVPPDDVAPELTPELQCLKDADALDRVRFGGLDARLLRSPLARALVGHARFLCDTSQMQPAGRNDPWGAVKTAASRMGLWSPAPALSASVLHRRLRHHVT